MNVRNLYACQFEELREKLDFADTVEHLEDVGAHIDGWTDNDYYQWTTSTISDALVIKSFDGYDFTCDDFFCTAGQYDEFPDREVDVNHVNKDVVKDLIENIIAEFCEYTRNLEDDSYVYDAIDKLYDYLLKGGEIK